MALLVVRNGVLEVERYQYDRTAEHRFLSNSMAKTVAALAIAYAAQEGKLRLDDRADLHAPTLAGTLYGEATVRQLLRMSSGARFEERYDGKDDLARYGAAVQRGGAVFNYASAETDMLALVLYGATGQTLGPRAATHLRVGYGVPAFMADDRGRGSIEPPCVRSLFPSIYGLWYQFKLVEGVYHLSEINYTQPFRSDTVAFLDEVVLGAEEVDLRLKQVHFPFRALVPEIVVHDLSGGLPNGAVCNPCTVFVVLYPVPLAFVLDHQAVLEDLLLEVFCKVSPIAYYFHLVSPVCLTDESIIVASVT